MFGLEATSEGLSTSTTTFADRLVDQTGKTGSARRISHQIEGIEPFRELGCTKFAGRGSLEC
jgi:hypothetical protein